MLITASEMNSITVKSNRCEEIIHFMSEDIIERATNGFNTIEFDNIDLQLHKIYTIASYFKHKGFDTLVTDNNITIGW